MATSTRTNPLENDFPFEITSHLVPVAVFREYPNAIIDDYQGLRLAVKQYVPQGFAPDSRNAEPITIVAAGALGFIKEVYEPLFAEIFYSCQKSGVQIRSIWIADMFNVGESAMENKGNLGCDPAWIDHSRDLWGVMTHFRDEMVKPIVGLGHSFGCNQLLCLSSWHPSLFHSFAFIEPGIDRQYGRGITIPWALQTLKQRDSWPTREEAEASLVKFNDATEWDERVVARLKHYSITQHGSSPDLTWATTTSKDQIAALVSRFNPDMIGLGPGGLTAVTPIQREVIPDSDPDAFNLGPFYRHELKLAWDMLPNMRPWVLYINGSKSPFFGHPETREARARCTGTGVGGNGGMDVGAAKQVVIEGGKHTMVFDGNIDKVANCVVDWLQSESQRWTKGPKKHRERWLGKSFKERQSVGGEFVTALAMQMGQMKMLGKL